MGEPIRSSPAIIGRENELDTLKQHLADAMSGKGCTVLISGEPGIGKTALVEEFRKHAEGARILSGAAMSGSAQPFQIFSKALEGLTDKPLFEESEYTSFTEIFAVNGAGLLLAKASSEEGGLDADIFAGMLSAVQDFVRDSFGGGKAGLGRLEYGDMKILIEHGQHLFLTAVFSGTEHPDMRNSVTRTLKRIEESHGQLIEGWSGRMSEIAPVQDEITALAGARFRVRRGLEGVKLENERLRIADRVLETLEPLAGDNAMVLMLEDLHWADESSLFVLNYLARNIRSRALLILGTARPREEGAYDRIVEGMRDEGTVTELALEKLGPGDVAGIMDGMYPGNDFPGEFRDMLAQRCGGNPLFVVEFLRHMRENGAITEREGRHVLTGEKLTVPDSIEDLIHTRLDRLGPEAISMAEYASCIGRLFDIDAAMSIPTVRDPGGALGELQAAGMVERANGTAEFGHAMYRDVIYSSISSRWLSAHHRCLGEHYERKFDGREDEAIYELARHFSKTNEHRKAFGYCLRAGEKAEGAFAIEQAIEHYGRALELSHRGGGARERVELGERLGGLLSIECHYQKALDSFMQAMGEADDAVRKARLARHQGAVYEKWGRYDDAEKALSEAESLLSREDAPLESGTIHVLRGMILARRGDYPHAMEHTVKGIALLEPCDSREAAREMAQGLNNMGVCHVRMNDIAGALDSFRKALEISRSMDDMQGAANAYHNLGNAHYATRETGKALDFYKRSLELKEKVGDRLGVVASLNNIGVLHYTMGEHGKALEHHRKSLELKQKIGDYRGTGASYNNIGIIYQNMGEHEKALEYYARCLEVKLRTGEKHDLAVFHENVSVCQFELGLMEEARTNCARAIELSEEVGDRRKRAEMELRMAGISLKQGMVDDAEERTALAERIIEETGDKRMTTWALRQRGMNAAGRGDWAAADRYFDESLRAAGQDSESLGKAEYEWAMCLRSRGEAARAGDILSRALSRFEDVAMGDWAKKCRRALAEITPPQ